MFSTLIKFHVTPASCFEAEWHSTFTSTGSASLWFSRSTIVLAAVLLGDLLSSSTLLGLFRGGRHTKSLWKYFGKTALRSGRSVARLDAKRATPGSTVDQIAIPSVFQRKSSCVAILRIVVNLIKVAVLALLELASMPLLDLTTYKAPHPRMPATMTLALLRICTFQSMKIGNTANAQSLAALIKL